MSDILHFPLTNKDPSNSLAVIWHDWSWPIRLERRQVWSHLLNLIQHYKPPSANKYLSVAKIARYKQTFARFRATYWLIYNTTSKQVQTNICNIYTNKHLQVVSHLLTLNTTCHQVQTNIYKHLHQQTLTNTNKHLQVVSHFTHFKHYMPPGANKHLQTFTPTNTYKHK